MVRTFPSAVETAEDLPSFCPECGRGLVVEDRTDHFDRVTGAPVLVAYAYCRGPLIARLFTGTDHEDRNSFVVSPRPRVALPPPDPSLIGTL